MSYVYNSWDLTHVPSPYEKGSNFLYGKEDEGIFKLVFDHEVKTGIASYLSNLGKDTLGNWFSEEPLVSVERAKEYYGLDIDKPIPQNRAESLSRTQILNNLFEEKYSRIAERNWSDPVKSIAGALSGAILDPVSLATTAGVGGLALASISKVPRILKFLSSGSVLARFGKAAGTIGVIDAGLDVGLEEIRSVAQEDRLLTPGEVGIQVVASAALGGFLTTGSIRKMGQRLLDDIPATALTPEVSSKALVPFKRDTNLIRPTEFFITSKGPVKFKEIIPSSRVFEITDLNKSLPVLENKTLVELSFIDPKIKLMNKVNPENIAKVKALTESFNNLSLNNVDMLDFGKSINLPKLLNSPDVEKDIGVIVVDFKAKNITPEEIPKIDVETAVIDVDFKAKNITPEEIPKTDVEAEDFIDDVVEDIADEPKEVVSEYDQMIKERKTKFKKAGKKAEELQKQIDELNIELDKPSVNRSGNEDRFLELINQRNELVYQLEDLLDGD